MNNIPVVAVIASMMYLSSHSTGEDRSAPDTAVRPAQVEESSGTASGAAVTGGDNDETLPDKIAGAVIQTLAAGRYVYLEIAAGTGTVWVAAPSSPVKKGDSISCRPQLLMEKYESPSLKRVFERVYFVGSLDNRSGAMAMPSNHPAIEAPHAGHGSGLATNAAVTGEGVARAEGGVTIAELAAQRDKLADTEVLLRAKVVRYNADILDANWLRVADASGKRDLVVTTKAEAKPGDTVLIRGKLERDVDLGSGYAYDIIIRDANIIVERKMEPARK